MGVHACTIVARNYLAQARVLAESFAEHHPDGTFTVLVLDLERYPLAPNEPFGVVGPHDLGLEEVELRRMAGIYSVLELATALKPWFLRRLLEQHEHMVYLDPDIAVFRPLDEIAALARSHSVVLTPHLTDALNRATAEPTETTILFAGVYNLGFLAVSREAQDLLDWWADRLRRDCFIAPQEGRFVDQRWLDLLPGFRERHHVLRDPQYNVAWWNLPTRRLGWTGEEYTVDGRPLAFFHFSAYDPRSPHLLSRHQGAKPKTLLSEQPALKRLCDEYGRRLVAQGFLDGVTLPYGYDTLACGVPVTNHMRRLYRAALRQAEAGDGELPPTPFDLGTEQEFLDWLREPEAPGAEPRVSRYLQHVWAHRADLQHAFPDLRWTHSAAYLRWVAGRGRVEEAIPSEFVPEPDALRNGHRDSPARLELTRGINICGYFRAELGVGEAGRKVVNAVRGAEVPHATVTYTATSSRQEHTFSEEGGEPVHDTNLVCVNADRILDFKHDVGPGFFDGRYTIGVWWWEVSQFPAVYRPAFDAVDEIWVGSDFVRDAVAGETDKPVQVMPVAVEVPSGRLPSRRKLGLPDGFLFLFVFDFFSILERKNPLGLIEAFTRAFEPGEGAHLYVKSINGDQVLEGYERVHAAIDHPDITFVDGYVTAEERNGLMAACDCYASLHRSEGFGLTIAEAMAYGKPAIATGYSGNLTYMTPDNSYLVPWRPTSIPEACHPYPAGAEWAEPDLEGAASLLRRVFTERDEAAARGARGRLDLERHHTNAHAAAFVRRRLGEIWHDDRGGARPRPPAAARRR